MRLVSIPDGKYDDYRLNLIFDCYKWDPQFFNNNTIAKHVLVLTQEEHDELKNLTEKLYIETKTSEEFLNKNQYILKPLALPKKLLKEVKSMTSYEPNMHIRLMRFDFHPTENKDWMLSEVNSDVPGGFAEASLMPLYANRLLVDYNLSYIDFSDFLKNAINEKVTSNGRIALVHCTSFSDDRQVMQFLGDKLKKSGFKIIYCAADHIKFENYEAFCILDGNKGKIDAIIRFTPLEWLKDIKPKNWHGYFNTITPSCNHPIAIFTQTKRFPLIWDILKSHGIDLTTWRRLLPETKEVRDIKNNDEYIYKLASGRAGEKISIKEACIGNEFNDILADVKKHPKEYLMQKKFISKPILSDEGHNFHACIGSFCINGNHAGYYARISALPRIDSYAADIPVLIERNPS